MAEMVATLTALTDAGGGGPCLSLFDSPGWPCRSRARDPDSGWIAAGSGRSRQATWLEQLNRPHCGKVTVWAWFLGTALPLTAGPGWECSWPHSSGLCRLEVLRPRETSLSQGPSKGRQPSWPEQQVSREAISY